MNLMLRPQSIIKVYDQKELRNLQLSLSSTRDPSSVDIYKPQGDFYDCTKAFFWELKFRGKVFFCHSVSERIFGAARRESFLSETATNYSRAK
jgi:hypothetical protein